MKPYRGQIEQWKESPTPGYGLGYLIRGVCNPQGYRDLRQNFGVVIARDGNKIETQSAHYTLGEPYIEPRREKTEDDIPDDLKQQRCNGGAQVPRRPPAP